MIKAARIILRGLVQGVGFRPFVHRLALEFGVTGYVRNTSRGVEIHAETSGLRSLRNFYQRLLTEPPPLARILEAEFNSVNLKNFKKFSISESIDLPSRSSLAAPDIGICPDCLKELFDPEDRRYLYPFINCTNCGPRFSIIKDLPYDRSSTTMKNFRMCRNCQKEFSDIEDRRYHAQPDACEVCGPQVTLVKKSAGTKLLKGVPAIKETVRLLQNSAIVAVKGIGGFHIACNTYDPQAINKLRSLKHRPAKPFALMVPDLKEARKLCNISRIEETILESPERPIVLLEKKKDSRLSRLLAPDNNYLGIMLCYTPLHYLLFSKELSAQRPLKALVMTSANISDDPIEIDNASAAKNLKDICEGFLVNNRDIYNRTDDSIVQIMEGKPVILRRSRGYSPLPFIMEKDCKPTLACGAELKNTFCLAKNRSAFLSQYTGDLRTYSTFNFYKEAISRQSRLFRIRPKLICHDLHPDYFSTRYCKDLAARNSSLKIIAVQHHQAHLASVISEHEIKNKIIGVCFDGTGYGEDGNIWGGEFFLGDLRKFQRAGHLEYMIMPGGDKATQEPYRMAISYLYRIFRKRIYELKLDFLRRHQEKLEGIVNLTGLERNKTSSCGRLFDAVSALLGICDIITYEAQAAIRLQQAAEKSDTRRAYRFAINDSRDMLIIKSDELFEGIVRDLNKKVPVETIAKKFHNAVASMTCEVCVRLRKKTGINTVALSGGVFQNRLLLETTSRMLRNTKFRVYYNELVPSNDGAVSLGQIAIANSRK